MIHLRRNAHNAAIPIQQNQGMVVIFLVARWSVSLAMNLSTEQEMAEDGPWIAGSA